MSVAAAAVVVVVAVAAVVVELVVVVAAAAAVAVVESGAVSVVVIVGDLTSTAGDPILGWGPLMVPEIFKLIYREPVYLYNTFLHIRLTQSCYLNLPILYVSVVVIVGDLTSIAGDPILGWGPLMVPKIFK